MKLAYVYLFCLACIACITLYQTKRNYQILNELSNACKYAQRKTGQFGIATWWAKRLNGKLKFVLLWPNNNLPPFSEMGTGQDGFIKLQCPVINCFVTDNRTFFKDIRMFDFIAFMGRNLYAGLPELRTVHQTYIYFNMESSNNYLVIPKKFDGYFNWTATYRLDSDIPLPYIQIRDREGNVVGPKINMTWVPEVPVDEELLPAGLMKQKTEAAAIFYSNCQTVSVREEVIPEIQRALKRYGLQVDVFGECGPYKCPRMNTNYCNKMLMKKYFFYLSFENSLDIDYVTEKLLTAVQNYVVPVVYGGANYSRFLPPRSYLDSTSMTATQLAYAIAHLMSSPKKYLQYFWWRKHYTYHSPILNDNICDICAAMNNQTLLERNTNTEYTRKFRLWWNNNDYYMHH